MTYTPIFCRKYAGGTLRDTLSRAFPPPVYYMTKYEYLLSKKENGELSILIKDYGFPSYYPQWMEYYEFYCEHGTMSYTELSCYFHVTRSTIYRAVQFMKSPHIGTVPKLRNA